MTLSVSFGSNTYKILDESVEERQADHRVRCVTRTEEDLCEYLVSTTKYWR